MPNVMKKGTKLGRGEARELILVALNEGKTRRKEIMDYIKMSPRTFTKAVNRLIGEEIVLRTGRGEYMLKWHIPLQEAVESIWQALQRLGERYATVTLTDIAAESKVPVTWKIKLGENEVTFSDIAWGLSRRLKVEIGAERIGKPAI